MCRLFHHDNAARKLYLRPIETIENEALRICLGAYKTTPINSLHIEANELPFSLRSIKIGLNLFILILSDPRNPSYNLLRTPNFPIGGVKRPLSSKFWPQTT